MRLRAKREVWSDEIGLIGIDRVKGNMYRAMNTTMESMPEGSWVDPFIKLSLEEAQEFMDSLYACGIRPSAATGSAGQLDSVKYHLEDMRKLVFK